MQRVTKAHHSSYSVFSFFHPQRHTHEIAEGFLADNVKYITFYGAVLCTNTLTSFSPLIYSTRGFLYSIRLARRHECDYETCLCLLLQFCLRRCLFRFPRGCFLSEIWKCVYDDGIKDVRRYVFIVIICSEG